MRADPACRYELLPRELDTPPPDMEVVVDEGEKMDYTTTSLALIGRTPLPAAQERKEAVMRARAMKAELTKRHVNLALNAEYFLV